MDFSELFKVNGSIKWSPNNKYLAIVDKFRVFIRDADTLTIINMYTCLDTISNIEWSNDSQYILCTCIKRRSLQVWSIRNEDWTCTIDGGIAGLIYCSFTPDSRHIITIAEFSLRLTIWSLTSKTVCHIKYPKVSLTADKKQVKGLDFSTDGKFLAIAERKMSKDYINIYDTSTYSKLKYFQVDTNDLYHIKWSPSNDLIVAIDNIVENNSIIYTCDGKKVKQLGSEEDHQIEENSVVEEQGQQGVLETATTLGIKTSQWSPNGLFLALGSYDQIVRIYSQNNWNEIVQFKHNNLMQLKTIPIAIYQERLIDIHGEELADNMAGKKANRTTLSKYFIASPPLPIATIIQADIQGIGIMEWSIGERLLLTRNDNMPTICWIWDMKNLCLHAVLMQRYAIIDAKWDPLQLRLVICTAEDKLFLWTPDGASTVNVPAKNFNVRGLEWKNDGTAIVLYDQSKFCCCYLPQPVENEQQFFNQSIEEQDEDDDTPSSESIYHQ